MTLQDSERTTSTLPLRRFAQSSLHSSASILGVGPGAPKGTKDKWRDSSGWLLETTLYRPIGRPMLLKLMNV